MIAGASRALEKLCQDSTNSISSQKGHERGKKPATQGMAKRGTRV